MSFDLGAVLKSPWTITSAPFKKREGQPFAQGAARNLGHAFFGDALGGDQTFANNFEHKYLGDYEGGTRHPTQQPGAMTGMGTGIGAGGTMPPVATQDAGASGDPQTDAWKKLLQTWMQSQQSST